MVGASCEACLLSMLLLMWRRPVIEWTSGCFIGLASPSSTHSLFPVGAHTRLSCQRASGSSGAPCVYTYTPTCHAVHGAGSSARCPPAPHTGTRAKLGHTCNQGNLVWHIIKVQIHAPSQVIPLTKATWCYTLSKYRYTHLARSYL